ncbi:DUF4280 domain-containing protein [Brevibacillus sp. DP1.3A]|uniref:DUF4280 domain-containing protein n=1 Tax=Brevibacillus sp. DP1.3A TaxID=2738867 RepID=UPI00351D5284
MPNIEGINIQQSSAERKSYVVVGAILSCSSGSKQSRLKMPFSHGVFVKGKPQVSIMDFVPNINIMPFGKCSSLKNPAVASATAANNGVHTPMPCTPLTTMPWMDGKADKMVGGHPALLNNSTNMCFHCGLIKIEDDGQDLGGVTIGSQSPANSGPSATGFGQGPACEKPQEKPNMWDNFVKGISKLGDVPAAMQKAASELPGALEKAANDLPKGLKKAAEDLPKGIEVFVREGHIEPMQEDLDTLRDEDINLEDALAISGLVVHALTLGRSKNVKDLVKALKKGKKRTGDFKPIKEVEIVDMNGRPIGEFDEIDMKNGIFYEDKTAKGLDILNPKTGLPAQTPQQFADKQILTKTRNRINNLHKSAVSSRPAANGSPEAPSLEEIKGIRQFVFRLDGDTPELREAVEKSLEQLRKEFPEYTFNVQFGGR